MMLVLLAIAVVIVVYNLIGGSSSVAKPASQAAPNSTAKKTSTIDTSLDNTSLDTSLRLDILQASENVPYHEGGRNIFTTEQAPIPAPATGVRNNPAYNAPPLVTPTTPTVAEIPLKFYGFANKPGEQKTVFLSDGGEHFTAKEGDIIDRRYRVVQISNFSLTVEDVLSNNKQSIPLTANTPN
ncbi:MAG TPA: hypothetical protein VFK06_22775 [Candidatus Angelobacter sp.]|nr:hypothetical protein [Candidatus Angelobacter sp.]